ncbi:helix-turn-helix domain-containing protein [Lentilitoribacter sp. EG35]|uniref:helix-turn-helix domain-containing protein n=1 Tax=Lentilitoribacter sp. EG35 TaxID=3234192 RepID=UPI00345F66FF
MTVSTHTQEYTKFTEILKQTRLDMGLTQQDVADRLDKPQSYVAKLENSERRIDVVEFIHLAIAIGADPKDLFDRVFTNIS